MDGTPLVLTAIQTGADGSYLFAGLQPGGYTVTVSPPAGYLPTLTGQGTPATDSSTGSASSAVLTSGSSDRTLDFGFTKVSSGVLANTGVQAEQATILGGILLMMGLGLVLVGFRRRDELI